MSVTYPREPMVWAMGKSVKISELRQMVEVARAIGAKRIRVGECEIEIADAPAPAEPPELTPAEVKQLEKDVFGPMPDDADLLEWSVPGPLPSEASKA